MNTPRELPTVYMIGPRNQPGEVTGTFHTQEARNRATEIAIERGYSKLTALLDNARHVIYYLADMNEQRTEARIFGYYDWHLQMLVIY